MMPEKFPGNGYSMCVSLAAMVTMSFLGGYLPSDKQLVKFLDSSNFERTKHDG